MTCLSFRFRVRLPFAALALACLLPAPRAWCFSSARPRLDLVIATSQRQTSPDARTWSVPANRPLLSWTHDTLFEFTYLDPIPRLRPVLAAERGSWDSQRTTLTLRIKKDTVFSNGEPITARHFVSAWESLAGLPADSVPQRVFLSRLRSYEARDSETLVLRLVAPDPEFEHVLALPFTAPIALEGRILAPSTSSTSHWSATQKPPATSGPFVLSDWHPGFGLVLSARRGYSNSFYPTEATQEFRDLGDLQHASKPLPLVDGIRVDWTESEREAWRLFSEGGADLLDLHPDFADEVLEPGKPWLLKPRWSAKGIRLEKGWKPRVSLVVLNLKTLPAAETRRKILARLGPDYWSGIPGFSENALPRADLPALPQLEGWLDLGTPEKSATRQAKSVDRKKTGPRETSTRLRLEIVGQDEQGRKMVESAQQRLEGAGFAAESRNGDIAPAIERFRKGETDVLILGWTWDGPTWRSVLDPILWLQPEEARRLPEFRELESAAASAAGGPAAKARRVHAALSRLAAWSPGPRHFRQTLVQPWVFGFHVNAAVESPEKYVRVDRELRKNYLGR